MTTTDRSRVVRRVCPRWLNVLLRALLLLSLTVIAVLVVNATAADAREPGAPYVDTDREALTVRSGPGTQFPATGRTIPDGTPVQITCQADGTKVTGKFGTSRLWDKLADGGYVSDTYVYTGTDDRYAPDCGPTEPPAKDQDKPTTSTDTPPVDTDTPPTDAPPAAAPEQHTPTPQPAPLPSPDPNRPEQSTPPPLPTPSPTPGPSPTPAPSSNPEPADQQPAGPVPYVHENLTVLDLAHKFFAKQGGRYEFHDGDIVTEQLREHDGWLQDVTNQIVNGYLPGKHDCNQPAPNTWCGRLQKSLLQPEAMFDAAVRDPANIANYLRGVNSDDSAVTYLGSYSLRYKVKDLRHTGLSEIRVTYTIYNQTTFSSATRVPVLGYLPEWMFPPKWIGDKIGGSKFPIQEQKIEMTVSVPISSDYTPSPCLPFDPTCVP